MRTTRRLGTPNADLVSALDAIAAYAPVHKRTILAVPPEDVRRFDAAGGVSFRQKFVVNAVGI